MEAAQQEYDEDYETQLINEEYKIWKKNTPFLYDLLITKVLEWPSLTVQWLPYKEVSQENGYSIHKLILGTHTCDNEPNHLMIAKVRIPLEETLTSPAEFLMNNKDLGGSGLIGNDSKLFEIETKIAHQGEVNKARYMPQKYNIIATKTVSGEVHIFDYMKHPTKPENNIVKPDLRLIGHKEEGYGLAWNSKKSGYLASASNDSKVLVWNIEANTGAASTLAPQLELTYHKGPVEDVAWHKFSGEILASVGDDKQLLLWDMRKGGTPTHNIYGHTGDINSVDFSPFNEYLVVTGSADHSIATWDIRNLTKRLHTFEGHKGDVIKVEWSPTNEAIFCSSSADRSIITWDLSKIGAEVKQEELVDGPPELLFRHAGHRAKIPDFTWNTNENMVLASVEEENNIIQIWQMNYAIYQDDDLEIDDGKL